LAQGFGLVESKFYHTTKSVRHLDGWINTSSNKKIRSGLWLIWHAIIWSIWMERNEIIFDNCAKDVGEIVEYEVRILALELNSVEDCCFCFCLVRSVCIEWQLELVWS